MNNQPKIKQTISKRNFGQLHISLVRLPNWEFTHISVIKLGSTFSLQSIMNPIKSDSHQNWSSLLSVAHRACWRGWFKHTHTNRETEMQLCEQQKRPPSGHTVQLRVCVCVCLVSLTHSYQGHTHSLSSNSTQAVFLSYEAIRCLLPNRFLVSPLICFAQM